MSVTYRVNTTFGSGCIINWGCYGAFLANVRRVASWVKGQNIMDSYGYVQMLNIERKDINPISLSVEERQKFKFTSLDILVNRDHSGGDEVQYKKSLDNMRIMYDAYSKIPSIGNHFKFEEGMSIPHGSKGKGFGITINLETCPFWTVAFLMWTVRLNGEMYNKSVSSYLHHMHITDRVCNLYSKGEINPGEFVFLTLSNLGCSLEDLSERNGGLWSSYCRSGSRTWTPDRYLDPFVIETGGKIPLGVVKSLFTTDEGLESFYDRVHKDTVLRSWHQLPRFTCNDHDYQVNKIIAMFFSPKPLAKEPCINLPANCLIKHDTPAEVVDGKLLAVLSDLKYQADKLDSEGPVITKLKDTPVKKPTSKGVKTIQNQRKKKYSNSKAI